MRSVAERAALVALAVLAGCGTWSNEDIAFVEALPTAQALHVALPAPAGQALCTGLGPSQVWGFAKPTGDGLNAGVDAMLAIVDVVKRYPPTTRHEDAREWGPFDDEKHPGKELRITMSRARDGAGALTYAYDFEARPHGGAFQTILDGTFHGESARNGSGGFKLHFDTLRALGMNDKPTDPTGQVVVTYDRTSDPRTTGIDLQQAAGGFGLTGFDYVYTGYASGRGSFFYAFIDAQKGQFDVNARFDETGAGIADVTVLPTGGTPVSYQQCWDAASCVTNVNDPFGISGLCTPGTCPTGACPSL